MDAPFDLDTVDRLLSTTRAVRHRLDLDRPVPREVLLDCIRLSQQSPTATNRQNWRWVVVTDAEKRRRVGEIYARGADAVRKRLAGLEGQSRRVHEGGLWLAENIGRVPVHVFPCIEGRPGPDFSSIACATLYGSILPAVWSFQLGVAQPRARLDLHHAAPRVGARGWRATGHSRPRAPGGAGAGGVDEGDGLSPRAEACARDDHELRRLVRPEMTDQ